MTMPEHLAKLRDEKADEFDSEETEDLQDGFSFKVGFDYCHSLIAEEMKAKDADIRLLKYEIERRARPTVHNLRDQLEQAQNKINALTLDCQAKDAEIERLSGMLTDRHSGSVDIFHLLIIKERDALKAQLTAANAKLEKLKDAAKSISEMENTDWPDRIFVAKDIARKDLAEVEGT